MNPRKASPGQPPEWEPADGSARPRILSPIDIFLDDEAATPDLFTIAFIFSFSTTVSPRSLLLSRGPEDGEGLVWIEADTPELGFHARDVHWHIEGLLLTLTLTDGHTFPWDEMTSVTVELMENRARGVDSCLGLIFGAAGPALDEAENAVPEQAPKTTGNRAKQIARFLERRNRP